MVAAQTGVLAVEVVRSGWILDIPESGSNRICSLRGCGGCGGENYQDDSEAFGQSN